MSMTCNRLACMHLARVACCCSPMKTCSKAANARESTLLCNGGVCTFAFCLTCVFGIPPNRDSSKSIHRPCCSRQNRESPILRTGCLCVPFAFCSACVLGLPLFQHLALTPSELVVVVQQLTARLLWSGCLFQLSGALCSFAALDFR